MTESGTGITISELMNTSLYSRFNFFHMLQDVEINEQNEYKQLAIRIFNAVIFDSIIMLENNLVGRPRGNPVLLTYDHGIFMLSRHGLLPKEFKTGSRPCIS